MESRDTTETLDATNNNPNECIICTNPFDGLTSEYSLKCNHKFHIDCIIKWFRSSSCRHTACPICRDEENTGDDHDDRSLDASLNSIEMEIPLNEREMNQLLSNHLNMGRRKSCPNTVKIKIKKYRAARERIKKIRRELYAHEKNGFGKYCDLRRISSKISRRLNYALERFAERAMELLEEDPVNNTVRYE